MFGIEEKRQTYIIYGIFMAVLALLAFENLSTHDFLDGWDDWDMMADMRLLSEDPSLLFSEQRIYDVRPPVDLVFLGMYLVFGENPVAYHLLQIMLHLLASFLGVIAFRKLGAHLEVSLLGGMLFLLNAAHFRAVHWIICINYVMALIFSLLLVLSFLHFLKTEDKLWLWVSLVGLCLAVLSHPSSASSALFCAYLAWRKLGVFRKAFWACLPLVLAVPVLGAVAHFISPDNALESEGFLSAPDAGRLVGNLLWYPGRLVSASHWLTRTTTSNTMPLWELGLGALVLVGAGLLYWRKVFPPADWAVWVVVSLLPFINNRIDRLAFGPSRQLYLASLGGALVLAWAIYTLANRFSMPLRRWVLVGLMVILAGSGIWSLRRAEALAFYFGARGYAFRTQADKKKGPFAIALFDRARMHAPELVPEDIYIRMATLGFTFGGFPKHLFQDALEKDPTALDVGLMLGIAEFMDEETRTAGEERVQRIFERSTEKETFRTLASLGYVNLGRYYDQLGRTDEAIELYQQALFWQPNYEKALTNLGQLLDKTGSSDEAIAHLKQAAARRPNDVDVLNNLASALANAKRFDEALEIYATLAKQLNQSETYLRLGQMQSAVEDFKAASQSFEHAVRLDPNTFEGWQSLGNVYFQLGNMPKAIHAYQKLALLAPKNVEVLNNLGYLFYTQNESDKALRILKQAQGVSPGHVGTLMRMALVYEKQGKIEDALKMYQFILQKEPDHQEAQQKALALVRAHFPEMLQSTGQ